MAGQQGGRKGPRRPQDAPAGIQPIGTRPTAARGQRWADLRGLRTEAVRVEGWRRLRERHCRAARSSWARGTRRSQERAPESRRAGPAESLPSPARSGSPRRELAVRKTRVVSLAAKHFARQHGLRGVHTLHCSQKFCSMLNVSRVWPGAAPQAGSRVL